MFDINTTEKFEAKFVQCTFENNRKKSFSRPNNKGSKPLKKSNHACHKQQLANSLQREQIEIELNVCQIFSNSWEYLIYEKSAKKKLEEMHVAAIYYCK